MNKESKIKTHYQEHSLNDVMEYFVKGFKDTNVDIEIISYEFFIDTQKNKVVLKIIYR